MPKANETFTTLHCAWLTLLFGSFASSEPEARDRLYDFSEILYRHLRFYETLCIESERDYRYERPNFQLEARSMGELADECLEAVDAVQSLLEASEAEARMRSDLDYMRYALEALRGDPTPLGAFDRSLRFESHALGDEAMERLVRFLFDESYKEYELIVIYSYAQSQVYDERISTIFQILIDESKFHLKSFARMMAELGILAIPRFVTEEIYDIDSLERFLLEGIDEELAAKEECRAISERVGVEPLARFFDFINAQESYHIVLMREALERYRNYNL